MNLILQLWHLQTLDNEIDDKTKRAHQVDEAIANDPAIAAAHVALQVEQKNIAQLRATMQDRELEAKGLDAKIKELGERLYGGMVTNPKELDGYAKELEMLKRNRSALDDKLLELMDSIEQAQKRVDAETNSFEQTETKRAGDLDHLTRERESLTVRLVELAAERETTRATLNSDSLRTYDRLRQTKAGRAVAQLKREACSACGMSVPTGLMGRVRTADEVVCCPSCGRILAP